MDQSSRRGFLKRATALLPASRLAFSDPLQKDNLGVQLYTVRKIIGQNPAGVLKSIQQIGYAEVEAIYSTLNQIWPALQQTNLRAVSVHAGLAELQKPETLATIKQHGFEYAVVPALPTNQGPDTVQRIAEALNKLGEQTKAQGITLCYHNHAHDFQPMNGTTALEMLLNKTQKDLVHLEMDVFWVSVAGHDPASLLKQFSGRVPLVHLKDKAQGVPVQYAERVPASAFVSVGSGTINFSAVLKAADGAGVKHYFVEQDQTPGDPLTALRSSYNYLKQYFRK